MNRAELAKALGVTPRTILEWDKAGMPVRARARARGLANDYDPEAVRAWLEKTGRGSTARADRGFVFPAARAATLAAKMPEVGSPLWLMVKAAEDWKANRVPLLRFLATLKEGQLADFPGDEKVWEALLHDFVCSEGAWRKIITHVLAIAERADDQGG